MSIDKINDLRSRLDIIQAGGGEKTEERRSEGTGGHGIAGVGY